MNLNDLNLFDAMQHQFDIYTYYKSPYNLFYNHMTYIYIYNYIYIYHMPGSTAQGGGGSFQNRKPIGEVRCCESWMAERPHRWIEKWLEAGQCGCSCNCSYDVILVGVVAVVQ